MPLTPPWPKVAKVSRLCINFTDPTSKTTWSCGWCLMEILWKEKRTHSYWTLVVQVFGGSDDLLEQSLPERVEKVSLL